MFEQTSQTEENGALVSEESTEAEAFIEGAMEDDVQKEAADTGDNAEQKYKVKYNGKEVELSLDELKTNAQKGMNYDHIKNELDTIKKSEYMQLVNDISRKQGKTPTELLRGLQDDLNRREYERLTKSGVENGDALDLVAMKNTINADARKEFADFAKNFPGIDPYTIPADVFKLKNEGGLSLSMAYAKALNNRLMTELKIREQNEKNTRTAVGSARSDGSARQADPFLAGMMGY